MKTAKTILLGVAGIVVIASLAYAAVVEVFSEKVTGGALDHVWVGGFNTPTQKLEPLTATPDLPFYANPSGDHTVGVATNADPNFGGICLTVTDPSPYLGDYSWEAQVFTGLEDTRRGLVVRMNPAGGITQGYMFVLDAGGFSIRLRKLTSESIVRTLATWSALDAGYGGSIPQNTWIKMKVIATGASFRCFISGPSGEVELPNGPTVDVPAVNEPPDPFLQGWVGVYNFRFDLGNVPVYFDDLILSADPSTPATPMTFGALKARYR